MEQMLRQAADRRLFVLRGGVPAAPLCGVRQGSALSLRPTPALTFLIREKSAKAYARGYPLHNPEGGTHGQACVSTTHAAVFPPR